VAGTYRLRLLVRAGSGRPRVISKRLIVGPQTTFGNVYASALAGATNPIVVAVAKGLPPHNPAVRLPVAAPGAHDRVGTLEQAHCTDPAAGCSTSVSAAPSARSSAGPGGLTWALSALGAVALLAVLALGWRRTRRRRAG
jgi:hypothetical protein